MKNKTLRSLTLTVALLSEAAGISITGSAMDRLDWDLTRSAESPLSATITNERVGRNGAQPIQSADGPEEVPPAIQIADGPEEVPPAAVLVADGPEEVPPAIQIADGPEEVPPAASLIV